MEKGTSNSGSINLSGDFHIAYQYRPVKGKDTVVFIHGFGSAKEHFRHAFDSEYLNGYSILTFDLVGFGKSRGPDDFGYSMEDQASLILQLLENLEIKSFHLCAHSMGGIIAIHMAELQPARILSIIDLEGNLTREDCFFSGKIAAVSLEKFEKIGRRVFQAELKRAAQTDPAMQEYSETFNLASTIALHRSAVQTVADSTTPLVERLSHLRNVCYIYGERNRGIFPGERLLLKSGIPVFYIKNAGHSMATDNPGELYRVIHRFIDDLP